MPATPPPIPGPVPTFDPENDTPDLTGKVAVVTGGNAGVGYATVYFLAKAGAKVYMASRTESKAVDAIAELEATLIAEYAAASHTTSSVTASTPGTPASTSAANPEEKPTSSSSSSGKKSIPKPGDIHFLLIDLSEPASVKAAAKKLAEQEERLDILVNNAGLLNDHGKPTYNSHGVINTMATNVIGPWLFTRYLLPLLQSTASQPGSDVRVLNLGSEAHTFPHPSDADYTTTDKWNQLFSRKILSSMGRYSYSKLGTHLWSNRQCIILDEEYKKENVPVEKRVIWMLVDPGAVYSDGTNTALSTVLGPLSIVPRKIMPLLMRSATQGAFASIFAAASPIVKKERERYHGIYLRMIPAKGKSLAKAKEAEAKDAKEKEAKEGGKEEGGKEKEKDKKAKEKKKELWQVEWGAQTELAVDEEVMKGLEEGVRKWCASVNVDF